MEHIMEKDIEQNERCVICKEVTDVNRNIHIDHRMCYIEGIGQLCCKCFLELKNNNYPQ